MSREHLIQLCEESLIAKSLGEEYKKRLDDEIRECDNQSEHEYWIDLYRRHVKFPVNENNLLIPYLLDIVKDFDISKPPITIFGDMPDADVDYLAEVRDYLKNEWAPKVFGADHVCAIGSYNTFGIKGAFIDCARVFGKDRKEILSLTTKLDAKDDEGKDLSYDKMLELYPDFKAYCEKNPDVADAARRLLHRNRSTGTHAGGLIISNVKLDNFIPLILGKDGVAASAFVEGLHGTDLGPLGLIKFDLLVITDLFRIAEICKLVKQRHGLEYICALPGQPDWSDTVYLSDPKSLDLADKGRTRGIFQFDGEGIQEMIRKGGVDCFNDLVAYSALYRPSAMQQNMHTAYIKRKNDLEEYTINPVLEPILGNTYGVQVFQEQAMRVLHVVGKIPLIYCEKLRKAISKKKEKEFLPYKEQFIINGQEVLGASKEEVENLFQQVSDFSGYGFNRSHSVAYSVISARLLYLKAYYPIEFYAGTLACAGTDEKIKDMKLEAERDGIKVNRVDINKSGWNFQIKDEQIYMGFSNVKGIGEEVSKRIVASQPYSSFEDFLNKFGTDASVLKPLIGLRIFKDDPVILYEFYEHYKKERNKRENRDKRAIETQNNIFDEVTKTVPKEFFDMSDEDLAKYAPSYGAGEDLIKLIKKYKKNVEGLKAKQALDMSISFADFKPTGEIDPELKQIYSSIPQIAESKYYGFGWDHILEYSPDYVGGFTFDKFEDESKVTLLVECQVVKKIEVKKSKKNTNYYTMVVEDANWKQNQVTVWEEDFLRFKDELSCWDDANRGHLLKLRLERPGPGFRSYTFDSPPKHLRKQQVPENKELDHRLMVMRNPEVDGTK